MSLPVTDGREDYLDYELPDGTVIHIHYDTQIKASECLFRRKADEALQDMNVDEALQDMIYASLIGCESGLRKRLLKNIIVAGGPSMLPGIGTRVQMEVNARCQSWTLPSVTGGDMQVQFTDIATGEARPVVVSATDLVHMVALTAFPSQWRHTVTFGADAVADNSTFEDCDAEDGARFTMATCEGQSNPFGTARVIAPPEGCISGWIGGSILAALSTHDAQWLTAEFYNEWGPQAIHHMGLQGVMEALEQDLSRVASETTV